jgi:hypothetical protein
MPIVGGLDIHRKQITFDYLDTSTGQVQRGQVSPADRAHLRAWLARFSGCEEVAFAVEACTGWRYVAEELAAGWRAPRLGCSDGSGGRGHCGDHLVNDLGHARRERRFSVALAICLLAVSRMLRSGATRSSRRHGPASARTTATSGRTSPSPAAAART